MSSLNKHVVIKPPENQHIKKKLPKIKPPLKNKPVTHIKEDLASFLELPKELLLNVPKLTIIGNGHFACENYKSVLQFDSETIKLDTTKGIITISGKALVISSITSEELLIKGYISSINFNV